MPALAMAIQLINTLIPLIPAASALFTSIQQQRNALETMLAEKREPTQSEWDALHAIMDSRHAAIQAAV